jgi:hypothetical protein
MNYLDLIASVIQAIAWPIAIALIVYRIGPRMNVDGLLDRIHKAGPTGVEFYQQEAKQIEARTHQSVDFVVDGMEILKDEIAAGIEKRNKAELAKISKDNKVPALLRALTVQQMHKSFAIAYTDIFGSQIRALEKLNTSSISQNEAEKMFSDLKLQEQALKDWTLEGYMNYLLIWNFVSFVEGYYSITETGRSFLHFVTENRLPREKLN